jgi:hypothetical protein
LVVNSHSVSQKHLRSSCAEGSRTGGLFIHTPEQPTDPQSLNLIVPSWSQSISRYLEREVDGVIHARSVDQFDFVNGITGEMTTFSLPAPPAAASEFISQLGYS